VVEILTLDRLALFRVEAHAFLGEDRLLGAEGEAVAGMVLAGRFRP
jgi:hypothetical protein